MTERLDEQKGKASVDQYLNTGIKPLIEEFPEVGQILERYGIGCVSCTIGTCKLGELVKLHALSSQDEAAMMSQIERAIYSAGNGPRPQAQTAVEAPRPTMAKAIQ